MYYKHDEQKTTSGRPSNATNFTEEEDVALCRAFVNVSADPIAGAEKRSSHFWADIK
jgi:hypothetical protein